MTAGIAWYSADRNDFLRSDDDKIVALLSDSASREGWHVETDQHTEWSSSVRTLQGKSPEARTPEAIERRLEIVREALDSPDLTEFTDVILEYDFRRRGLRIDCVLLAPGLIVVLEFKRTQLTAADRDQVLQYCISLVEFHEQTRQSCEEADVVLIPILTLTEGTSKTRISAGECFHNRPWTSVLRRPMASKFSPYPGCEVDRAQPDRFCLGGSGCRKDARRSEPGI